MSDTQQTESAPATETHQDSTDAIDFGDILDQHRSEVGKTVEGLRGELHKSHGTLERVRKAFAGDDEGEKLTPYQKRMAAYKDLGQHIEREALENQKKGGQGLPLTTRLGKELADLGIQSEQRAEKLEAELAEIKAALKRQQNPAFQGLERAAFIMEGMIDDGLEALYGSDAQSKAIRSAQFNAVTARVNEEIKDLMKNDPDALLKVQRNPKIMRKMVNHFMAEMLPPKVRTMLDDQRIQNEPISQQELYQAFGEARQQLAEAESKGDERAMTHYSNLMTDIRRDILGAVENHLPEEYINFLETFK